MRIIIFILLACLLHSKGVPAGTQIENSAKLNYNLGSKSFTVKSNKVIDIVDHKIDMKMSCQESQSVVVGVNELRRTLTFRLTNRGNGSDSYNFIDIKGEKSNFDVQNSEIYLDNGDGVFSIVNDVLVNDLNLSADENATLFLVSDIPKVANGLSINGIKVFSDLQEGLSYGDAKEIDNYYAVLSVKENALVDYCSYEISNLALEVVKSATLSSDKLYIGSTIHYSLALKVVGKGTLKDVFIADSIPENTIYVTNTLKLDGVLAGDFNGTAVTVNVGEIEQKVESDRPKHTITFDVRVR